MSLKRHKYSIGIEVNCKIWINGISSSSYISPIFAIIRRFAQIHIPAISSGIPMLERNIKIVVAVHRYRDIFLIINIVGVYQRIIGPAQTFCAPGLDGLLAGGLGARRFGVAGVSNRCAAQKYQSGQENDKSEIDRFCASAYKRCVSGFHFASALVFVSVHRNGGI